MGDGGDFNEIKNHEEKHGGIRRQESSFHDFRTFIADMGMGEIRFTGHTFTWANNREGEGFIQERLDRFFGSAHWMLTFDTAEVVHILRQASDRSLLMLDTKPQRVKTKSRFIFESTWAELPESEDLIKAEWCKAESGSRMYQVHLKLKRYKIIFIQ